ncbi:F-box protein SKIP23-like protein [Drosera capensis]
MDHDDLLGLANGVPWLLLPSLDAFYCFEEGELHHLEPVDYITANNWSNRGSSHGWLAMVEDGPLIVLFNPITTQRIQLPPFTTLPGVSDYRVCVTSDTRLEYEMPISYNGCLCPSCLKRDPARCWIRHDKKMLYVQRIILTGNPVSKEGCIAVAVLRGRLAFCRVAYGEAESYWTAIHQPEGVFVEDVVLWNDRLYVLDNDGLGVCNLEDSNPYMEIVLVPVREINCKKQLVVSPDNELFFISQECDPYIPFITGFKVHRLINFEEGWAETNDIRDYVIFWGANHSICLSATELPTSQLISNKIYFSDSYLVGQDDQLVHDFGIFNLETGRIEPLPVEPVRSWCLPPVWLTPFLTVD